MTKIPQVGDHNLIKVLRDMEKLTEEQKQQLQDVTAPSVYRDAWAAGTAYDEGDVVTHAGSVWKALRTTTGEDPALQGVAPSLGPVDETIWADFSDEGTYQIVNPAAGTYPQVRVATSAGAVGRVGFTTAKPANKASVSWLAYADITGTGSYQTATLNTPLVVADGQTLWGVWVGGNGTSFVKSVIHNGTQVWYGDTFGQFFPDYLMCIRAVGTAPAIAWQKTFGIEVRGTAAPTTGTHIRGDRVYNATPTAGGFSGWICVTSGTPGTWKTFGAISS